MAHNSSGAITRCVAPREEREIWQWKGQIDRTGIPPGGRYDFNFPSTGKISAKLWPSLSKELDIEADWVKIKLLRRTAARVQSSSNFAASLGAGANGFSPGLRYGRVQWKACIDWRGIHSGILLDFPVR